MMASCEAHSMTDSRLVGVSFERVNFRFWLEATDVLFNFRILFRSLYLFSVRLVVNFALYFHLTLYRCILLSFQKKSLEPQR